MAWDTAKLKYVTRFRYGDALPPELADRGEYQVFGSNGPYASCSVANTRCPAIIIGRKGSYGKINWSSNSCFASDTTFFVDSSLCSHELRWIFWLLQTLQLDKGTDEAAVPGLSRDAAYSLDVRIPPPAEQRAIANYLDRETARLDALVAEKERLLRLLEEKRHAMITGAVTRGLNPGVPFRHSGLPWLGEIPDHWEIWKLGQIASIGNGSTPARSRREYWEAGTIPWLNSSTVNQGEITGADQFVTKLAVQECHLPMVRSGAVLVAITGTRGRAAALAIDATINQHVAFISPRTKVSTWYLRWVLHAAYGYLRNVSDDVGVTKGALTCEELVAMRVPVPPRTEQREIVSEISSGMRPIEELIEATNRTIMLLKERRTTLVSAAVTGNIEVEKEV